jgi:hypothetical protein
MELRTNALLFPSTRNTGPVTASTTIPFARPVERAVAAITGYSATFENGEDHHLGRLDLELTTTVDPADPRNVIVDGSFGLRDWSNTWDDAYSGTVQITVLAELSPVTPGGPGDPRGDLIVTDAEITQAIQHFRSALHLDSANVFPDNSIRLVADKPCGVRLWIDYDRNSGLPLIAALTGTLLVQDAAGVQTTILPLNTIVPKRESQIARGMRNDTLNFVIPESLCRGNVTITARVFGVGMTDAFSADFQRTLQFESMVPVRVFDVAVNYTGPDVIAGMPTGAPTPADFVTLFGTTELLFPIPQVMQTGFMTMDFDGEIRSDISKGCDKVGDLRDDVSDLRGDSTDIFYALLNSGVDTGTVGGCGGSGGAGVGIVGSQGTVAHELGHVLGRRHVPCDNVTRCQRPLNTDGDYPVYSGFDSDSIGEFGFNTSNGAVLQPGNAHDMMGYSGNAWISPYTYKALMTRIPQDNGGVADIIRDGAPAAARRPDSRGPIEIREQIRKPAEHLFLRLAINRDRSVDWRTAFHFPTWTQGVSNTPTKFVVELRDGDGKTLASECLYQDDAGCGCGCGGSTWPKRFRQAIPYDPSARRLVVLECDKVVFDEAIPDPPKVHLECRDAENRESKVIRCRWHLGHEGGQRDTVWYLLQWRDRKGVWRGVAPRTQRTEWDVPKALWGRGSFLAALRVLASGGIATGFDTCEVKFAWGGEAGPRGPRRVTVGLAEPPAKGDATVELPPIVRATVTGPDGATVPGDVGWFGATGGLYGRGRSLQLSALPHGVHVLRAAVSDTGHGSGEASWLVERTRDDRYFLHRGTIRYPDPDCGRGDVSASLRPRSDPPRSDPPPSSPSRRRQR